MARPRLSLRLLLAVLLATPAFASAAEDWPVSRGPSREPQPYRHDPADVSRLPRKFLDDAPACVLYAGNTYLVEADGTIETITHEIIRLNSRKGIDKLGEFRDILYDPSFQKLTLNEARIHKAGGRTVAVEPRHVQLRDVATDYQIYDHEKQLIISFPTLEVGDVLEVKWTVRGKNPEHAGQFFTRYSFGDPSYPVALDEFRVRLPKAMPFRFASTGGKIEPVQRDEGDWRTYTWQAHNTPRQPQDDNLPSREELRPALACSTFASWEDVGRWKQRLRADCWQCSPEVGRLVGEVTRGPLTPEAKARALTYWLRHNIRYVSTGEKHDYTPHPPARVLANRYGDCKDTSQLLAVMLREAGLAVELATLGALDDGQVLEAVPSPWGTHAILLVTIDGKEHWIDTTLGPAAWDFLPRDDRDRLCYLVDAQGHIRLKRTPPMRADDNRIEQITHVWIGADGSSRCEREVISHGMAAAVQRDALVEVPVGERRRQAAADLQDANSRTRLLRLAVNEKELADYDRPVKTRMVFEVPGHFSGHPDREGSITDSKVWGKLLAYNLDYERAIGFNLGSPFESRHRYVLHLPPAYHLDSVPHDRSVRCPCGLFTRKVRPLDEGDIIHNVEIEFHTRLERGQVSPADFEAFRRFHEEVAQYYRAWLTLKPAEDPDEARLLEALLCLAPQDSASAEVLARMYLKEQRTAEARRVLARARYYRPDVAALWELSVRAAATPKEEEELQRELVRRFPDDTSHALQLGSILVGQGKQEQARAVLEPISRTGSATQRARAHFHLARSYYRRDELEEALKHLLAAAAADPEVVHTVRAYHLKGQIYEELGKPHDAARAYEAALEVEPNSEIVLDSLIRLQLVANNRARALDYLRRYAVAVGDDDTGALLAAGYYLRLDRPDDAMDLVGPALKGIYADRAHRILGLGHLHKGDFAHAAAHLAQADAGADVFEGMIRSLLELGRLAEVSPWLEKADKLAKSTPELKRTAERARRVLARRADFARNLPAPAGKEKEWGLALDRIACAELARAEGRPAAQVEALLQPAFASGLEPGPAFALRGRLALERGKLSAALADAEEAIRRSPRQAAGYYVRGRVRLERNDIGALADLEKAAQVSGRQDADVLHALAEALFRAGRVEQALAAQREAVKLRPRDRELTEQLAAFEKASRRGG
jgi:tetratricopeptide (TPR) repeat protein